jgi:NADPH:quinone reductase-like Zn-dependent oxidoreductase
MSVPMIPAIRVYQYGGADQLRLESIPRPVPQDGEVLVRVQAIGVNPVDWKIRQGLFHAFSPSQFPYIPGADLAGIVEGVGPNVTTFQAGQAVFGQTRKGSYTEYAVAPVSTLALKPASLSFDKAAAIPVGATTAWQGLFDHGNLQPGQRVLILGASGGVGLFAVQFARWKGAHVIGTTSTPNVDYVRSLGADQVIDYTNARVEDTVRDVDLVFDGVGGSALDSVWPVLKEGGTLITIAGQPDEKQAEAHHVRAARFSAQVSSDLLDTFARMVNEDQLKVTVGKQYTLEQARQAHEESEQQHGLGRIVLIVP